MNPFVTPIALSSAWAGVGWIGRCLGALALAGSAILVAGCGGGVGTGGTGSFAQGAITGFGSIIVNDVRFDESGARIEDDDGAALASSALRLGMVVQVQGGPLTSAAGGATAVASLVRINRALVGPAAEVNLAAGQFRVLGQPVAIGADTVLDDRLPGGLAGAAQLGKVEVYGWYDAGNARYVATRVAPAAAGAANRVAGPAAQIDTATRSLRIGSQTYSYANLGNLQGLSEGAVLRLTLPGGTDAAGRWIVGGQGPAPLAAGESSQHELRGLVQSVGSATRFVVDGVEVDAATARIDGSVVVGARAKVSGTVRNGVLVATRVSVENSGSPQKFELKGSITSVDASNRRFVVRETTVSWARSDVQFDGGAAAQLAVGRKVEVEGQLSADRAVLEATKIKFDD